MPVRLGPDDGGGVVGVAAGDLVEVVLPENAGTGYRWQLDPLPPGLVLVADDTEPPSAAAAGGQGRRRFTVRADRPGVLAARLRRGWEPADRTAAVFTVQVRTT